MPLTHTDVPVPRHYVCILYPGYQLLDWAGPLDILSTGARDESGMKDTVTFVADTSASIPMAMRPPEGSNWTFEPFAALSSNGTMRGTSFNVSTAIDLTFEALLDQLAAHNGKFKVHSSATDETEWRTVDCLLIPGGFGARLTRIDNATGTRTSNIASSVSFIKKLVAGDFIRSAILTVCTGSYILGQTGLLDGRRACTNHLAYQWVADNNRKVDWLPNRRFVRSMPQEQAEAGSAGSKGTLTFDKEIWTGAGISSGMDLMFWFVAETKGMNVAKELARRLEIEWRDYVKEGEVDEYYLKH